MSAESQVDMTIRTELDNAGALEKVETSTQLDDRNVGTGMRAGIEPPYPPTTLAAFLELNSTHSRAVAVKSLWEVGFGFDIVPHPQVDNPDESQRERVEEFWNGRDSEWMLGPDGTASTTPEEVLACGRRDWHGIGWSSLEILTNNGGEPTGLAHVPSTTTRVRKAGRNETEVVAGTGYVQSKENQTRYFGEAGDRWGDETTFVDKGNGTIHDSGSECPNGPANELLFVVNPSSLSLYYGIPDWIPTMTTMVADEAAQEYNREFFEHNTVPYLAVIVNNGTLSEESRREIRQVIHGLKGEPHRTVLLEAEKIAERDFTNQDGNSTEIEIKPLGMDTNEDMAFSEFRKRTEHDISKVHGVPKLLLNRPGDSNYSNAQEQIRAFANQQIAPNQERFAERLYRIIHVQGLDAPDWTIDFELRGADNPAKQAEIAKQKLKAAPSIIKVDEGREMLGLDPLDGEMGEMMITEAARPAGGTGSLDDALQSQIDDAIDEAQSNVEIERLMNIGATAD